MQLREKALALVFALAATFASTSVFASIPRSEIFAPAIERFAFESAPPAHPESTEVLPLVNHFRSAAGAAWPLESLPETRIGDFDFVEPLLPQAEPQLSRALRQGYERLERRRASGDEYQDSSNLYSFCGGDPVNCSDPDGMQARTVRTPNPVRTGWRKPRLKPRQTSIGDPRKSALPETVGEAWSLDEGPESIYQFQKLLNEANRTWRPGATALGGKTANELSPAQQADFLEHRRRLRSDAAYRAQWEAMEAGTLELQAELLRIPLPALGGAGGGDGGDDGILTPWGIRSRSTGKFIGGARRGVDPVEDFITQAEANGFEVLGREISFKTPFEMRRVDVVLRNRATGQIGGFEIKSSRAEFNKLKKEQFAADRYINRQGAQAVGKNAERAGVERIDSVMKVLWEP